MPHMKNLKLLFKNKEEENNGKIKTHRGLSSNRNQAYN